ncbi:unnamed protein product [Rotaria sp. Silwood1]|nr:unnamed protein product [Rotaria sp. Silwood1]
MRVPRYSLILFTFTIVIISVVGNSTGGQRQEVPITDRIDCYPEAEAKYSNFSKDACLARNCLFDESTDPSGIQCYLRATYGYQLQQDAQRTPTGIRLCLQRNQAIGSPFPEPIENILLDVQYYTNDIIRFKLYDADNPRYEVPLSLTASSGEASSPLYEFIYSTDSARDNLFSFGIRRRADSITLFDTSIGDLVLNNQFLQIVTRLQSPHVYGFGENNHETLKHNVTERKIWVFSFEIKVSHEKRVLDTVHWDTNANHYGTHPFYLVMEQVSISTQVPSDQMHGVLLINSNAMDYSFGPEASLTIRTIGGILDFFVFLGPSPEQVVQQYTWLIGRSFLPPYWGLGFHLSRWGYGNLTNMKMVNKRNRDADIPLDVQYADIDYMDAEKDFTVDPINYRGLKEFFSQIRTDGMRTIVILDPGTIDDQKYYAPTIEGIKEDVFIKWENGRLMKALFNTNDDFAWNWDMTGTNYTLKCPSSKLDDPPYRTKAAFRYDETMNRTGRLSDHTLCMTALQGEIDPGTGKPKYRHYDVHSLYGWSQTKPTLDAIQSATGKRSMILPRSTFVGSGQWGGHWLGDNEASWVKMKQSLIGMIEFNWFGISFNGADICGFDKSPTEEIWMQVGAFYPFSRNHNIWKTPDQDPAAWSPSATAIMASVLRIRYTLLPYYYTLFYKAHTQGSTVIRPLFHEYPTDRNTQ